MIASPATLTSVTQIRNTSIICDGIQTIEFVHDDTANISAPSGAYTINDGRQGLAYINLMPSNQSISYYDQPSMDLRRISTLSLLSNFGPLQASNPCLGGANCSYALSFKAPSYSCSDALDSDDITSAVKAALAPNGQSIYTALSDVEEDEWGAPVEWQYMTADNDSTIGIFTKEPSLLIGYIVNTTIPEGPYNNSIPWNWVLEQHVMQCVLFNATYDYSISFLNGLMNIVASNITLIGPLLEPGASIHPLDLNYGD